MKIRKYSPASLSDKRKGKFIEVLQSLTHQFSQPLTSLRGSIEVSLLNEENPERRRSLKYMLDETDRLAEVLESLREAIEWEDSKENS